MCVPQTSPRSQYSFPLHLQSVNSFPAIHHHRDTLLRIAFHNQTMTLSNTTVLAIVELAIYLLLVPQTIYLAYRHGRHAILGYLYLNLVCVVRIVADILQIAQQNSTTSSGSPSIASIVLSSLGISPLLLAIAGFLHEIHHQLLTNTASFSFSNQRSTIRWMWFAQVQWHAVCAAGIVLIIVGSVNLFSHAKTQTQEDVRHDDTLRSAGAVILAVLWLTLVSYCLWLNVQARKKVARRSVRNLAACTLVAAAFVGVKVLYAVVYTFDHEDLDLNPVTGSFAVKVVFGVGVMVAAVVMMVVGGWMSLGFAKQKKHGLVHGALHGGER